MGIFTAIVLWLIISVMAALSLGRLFSINALESGAQPTRPQHTTPPQRAACEVVQRRTG